MKKGGVVIDAWKLDIFTRHLKDAGFKFKNIGSPIKDTVALQIEYEWAGDLQPILVAANNECAKTGSR